MLQFSGTKIIRIIVFWYSLKVFGYSMLYGVSMACADGVRCSMYPSEFIRVIAPMFAYIVGGIILVIEKNNLINYKAINKALSTTFLIHITWSFIIYPFFIRKFYNLTQNIIFDILFPIIILSMIICIWLKNRQHSIS